MRLVTPTGSWCSRKCSSAAVSMDRSAAPVAGPPMATPEVMYLAPVVLIGSRSQALDVMLDGASARALRVVAHRVPEARPSDDVDRYPPTAEAVANHSGIRFVPARPAAPNPRTHMPQAWKARAIRQVPIGP